MSNKRKIEEYQDPDYAINPVQKKTLTSAEKSEKTRKIIGREFGKNIHEKTEEIYKIENRLQESKRLLQKVRYAVVAAYYSKQNLHVSDTEKKIAIKSIESAHTNQSAAKSSSSITQPDIQHQIHPSLKKLLGKKPINYDEILSIRPPRQAAKTASATIKERMLSKKEEMKLKRMKGTASSMNAPVTISATSNTGENTTEEKKPRYIEPRMLHKPIPQMNTARGRNQQKHLIAVGNTSKYIGDEKSADGVTHKWLVYICTKTKVPIEQLITKVRFFLHPSYQPNDVVEVSCPPFTISRRGWGEFPVRVQLYFHLQAQQKPLQIFHNLVLDKKMTGLQTMGAETVVEMWMNNFELDAVCKTELKSFKTSPVEKELKSEVDNNNKQYNSGQVTENENSFTSNYTEFIKTVEQTRNNVNLQHLKNQNRAFTAAQYNFNMKIKSEPVLGTDEVPLVETIAPANTPQLKLETTHRLIPISAPSAPHVVPPKPGKFIKCFDKNGKMSFVEVCYDPQNPKKILLKPNSSVIPIPVMGTSNNLQQPINSTGSSPVKLFVKTIGNTAQKIFVANSPIPSAVGALQRKSDPSSSQQQTQPLKPPVYLNENQVMTKNGMVYMRQADLQKSIPQAVKLRQRPKNQVSLLKKGVSLLKPIIKINNTNAQSAGHPIPQQPIVTKLASADHDYYFSKNCIQSSCVPLGAGRQWPNGEKQSTISETKPITNLQNFVHRDFRKELETLFLRFKFNSYRQGVDFLLKRIQLVNSLVTNNESFRQSFPFVVGTLDIFNNVQLPKQRSCEWSRAKLINRMIKKHPHLQENHQQWTTKEILIYARKFAFTPSIATSTTGIQMRDNKNYLKDIVKKEMKREKVKYSSLSLNQAVYDWMARLPSFRTISSSIDDDDVINIIDDDDDGNEKSSRQNNEGFKKSFMLIPLSHGITTEAGFVTETCCKVGIKLQPEEIVPDVLFPSAQMLLIQTAKLFIQDVLRRANEKRSRESESVLVETSVKCEDIKHALLSRREFDFLTNSQMGQVIPKSQPAE